jgi:SAM-dependent methyltransferase
MAETSPKTVLFESGDYPRTTQFIRELLKLSPNLLRGQIALLIDRRGDAFWREAERLLDLAAKLGGSPAASLIEYTVVYLKEQVRFLQTGEYSHQDFETARSEVYDNADVMDKYYLEGLLLSHAFWPIHFDIHEFFLEQFVARVPDSGGGAEYGFGHGLYLHDILKARPGATAKGFDISPYSRRFAERLLLAGGTSPSRFHLSFADVRQALEAQNGEYAWAVFAEIMEHIPDPRFSLGELHRSMKPGAPIFITTVVNSNAIDHLYLFRDPGEVRRMVEDAGFEVAAERRFRVADYAGNAKDPSVDLAYVALAE